MSRLGLGVGSASADSPTSVNPEESSKSELKGTDMLAEAAQPPSSTQEQFGSLWTGLPPGDAWLPQ